MVKTKKELWITPWSAIHQRMVVRRFGDCTVKVWCEAMEYARMYRREGYNPWCWEVEYQRPSQIVGSGKEKYERSAKKAAMECARSVLRSGTKKVDDGRKTQLP